MCICICIYIHIIIYTYCRIEHDWLNPPWELPCFRFQDDLETTLRFQVTFSNLKLKLSDDGFSPKAATAEDCCDTICSYDIP